MIKQERAHVRMHACTYACRRHRPCWHALLLSRDDPQNKTWKQSRQLCNNRVSCNSVAACLSNPNDKEVLITLHLKCTWEQLFDVYLCESIQRAHTHTRASGETIWTQWADKREHTCKGNNTNTVSWRTWIKDTSLKSVIWFLIPKSSPVLCLYPCSTFTFVA